MSRRSFERLPRGLVGYSVFPINWVGSQIGMRTWHAPLISRCYQNPGTRELLDAPFCQNSNFLFSSNPWLQPRHSSLYTSLFAGRNMVSANLGAAAIIKIPWQMLVLVSVIWYSWAGFVLAVCHKGPKTSWNWKSGLSASETTRDEMGFAIAACWIRNCSWRWNLQSLWLEDGRCLVATHPGKLASWCVVFCNGGQKLCVSFLDLKVWEASKPQELPNQTFDQRISEVGRAAFPRPDKNSSLGVEQNKQVGDEQSFGDRWHAEWHFGGWGWLAGGTIDYESERDHRYRP